MTSKHGKLFLLKKGILRFVGGFLIVAFGGALHAQKVDCPEAELLLPHGVVQIEQQTTLALRIVGDFTGSVEWKTSSGQILRGQGSQVLSFVADEGDEGKTVTVVAMLRGLPRKCPVELTGVLPIAHLPIGEPVDVLEGRWRKRDFQSRLDVYIYTLSESPGHEGLVQVTFKAGASRNHKIGHLNLIRDQLIFRKMNPSRITFYISEGESYESTTLWAASADARLPKYLRTLPTVKGEELRQKIPSLFRKSK